VLDREGWHEVVNMEFANGDDMPRRASGAKVFIEQMPTKITCNFPLGHPHFLTVTISCECCLRTLDVHH